MGLEVIITEEDIERTVEIITKEIMEEQELEIRRDKQLAKRLGLKYDKNLRNKIINELIRNSIERYKRYVEDFKLKKQSSKPETIRWHNETYIIHQNSDGVLEFRVEPTKESFDYYDDIKIKFAFKNVSDKNIKVNKRFGSLEIFHPRLETLIKYALRNPLGFSTTGCGPKIIPLELKDFIELKPHESYEKEFSLREFMDPFLHLNISPGVYNLYCEYSVYKGSNDGYQFNLNNSWAGVIKNSCIIHLTSEGMKDYPRCYKPKINKFKSLLINFFSKNS